MKTTVPYPLQRGMRWTRQKKRSVRPACAWTICCTLAISGCANTRIPADWPSFEESGVKGECISLAGQYSNTPLDRAYRESSGYRTEGGEGAHDYRLSQILGHLTPVAPAAHEQIMYMTIQFNDTNRIVISGNNQETGNTAISITLFREGDNAANLDETESTHFGCKNGFIHISRIGWAPITPIIAAGIFKNAYIRMRKSVDGSLIVNSSSDVYGTLPLVPVPITGSIEGFDTWYRFEPYTPQPNESDFSVNGKHVESEPGDHHDAKVPGDTFLNCFSSGERKWAYRSKCD